MKGRRNKKMSFSEDCVIDCVEENMYSLNENISILSNKYKSFSKLPNKIMELIAIKKVLSDIKIEPNMVLNDGVIEDFLNFIEAYSVLKDSSNELPSSICSFDDNGEDILNTVNKICK